MNVLSLFDGLSGGMISLERANIKVNNYYSSEIEDSAIEISDDNYKDIMRLGDITKLQSKELNLLPKIDLILAGSPCFVAGTRVLTKTGYKNIEDIKVGDMVLTHKNRYKKVLNIGGKISNTYSLKAQGVFKTTTTKNHPYYARTNKNGVLDSPVWKKVGDLGEKDYIGIPIIQEEKNENNLTEEECWILGRYIADGHIRNEKRKGRKNSYFYQVILSIGDSKLEEFKKRVTKQHFSCYRHSKSVHRCVISSKKMVDFIKNNNFGMGAKEKNIPDVIYNLPKHLIKSFIDGYICGDGYKKTEIVTRFSTISKNLVVGMSMLYIKAYGTLPSIYYPKLKSTTVIEGRVVNQSQYYEVTTRKNTTNRDLFRIEGGYIWTPVKEVCNLKNEEFVYNIEVEDDNSYTANNAVVHNCQGFSRNGNSLNFEHKQSKLFFDFIRILNWIKENNNSDVKFLLENVEMKKEWRDTITEYVGVEPLDINSKLLSAQNRPRTYWTNIEGVAVPNDIGVKLKDILIEVDSNSLTEHQGILVDKMFNEKELSLINVVNGEVRISQATKQGYIVAEDGDGVNLSFPTSKTRRGRVVKQKTNTLDKQCNVCVYYNNILRKLTIEELEKLQTLPIGYTKCVSESKRRAAIGNGWTIDVIVHILSYL